MKKVIFLFSVLISSIAFCGWSPTNTIISSNSSDYEQVGAVLDLNHSGYGVAVWGYRDGGPPAYQVQSSITTDFGKTWSPAVFIDQANISLSHNTRPRVALDESNHAIIVWQRDTGPQYEVRVTPYGENPQKITVLDAAAGPIYAPRPDITMDNMGNALAIWSHEDLSGNHTIKTMLSVDRGINWICQNNLDLNDPSDDETYPRIAMDKYGNAIATWTYDDGTTDMYTKVAYSSDRGITWSTPIIIDNQVDKSTYFTFPDIVMDNSGHAIIIWVIDVGPATLTVKTASSNDYGKTWSFSVIDPSNPSFNFIYHPKISMNSSGHAVATWGHHAGGATYYTKVAYSSDWGASWSNSNIVDPATSSLYTQPNVKLDDTGRAIVIWNHRSLGNIEIRRADSSDNGQTWTLGTLATGLDTTRSSCGANIFIDKKGNPNALNAIGLWSTYISPNSSTQMNHYQEIHLNVSGSQEKAQGYIQADLRNKLNAEGIGQKGIFKLYKDPGLTQLIDSTTTDTAISELFEHHVRKGNIYTYYITWTDEFGYTVGPVQVTVK